MMEYSKKYQELVELSHSENSEIKKRLMRGLSALGFREQRN